MAFNKSNTKIFTVDYVANLFNVYIASISRQIKNEYILAEQD